MLLLESYFYFMKAILNIKLGYFSYFNLAAKYVLYFSANLGNVARTSWFLIFFVNFYEITLFQVIIFFWVVLRCFLYRLSLIQKLVSSLPFAEEWYLPDILVKSNWCHLSSLPAQKQKQESGCSRMKSQESF